MRIGVLLMPTDSWTETVRTARRMADLGFHHLWVYDHLTWQRYRDRHWHATYPWLAGLAASRMIPGCVQRPRVPLAVAAGGPKGLRLAAQYGDAWITYGDTTHTEISPSETERIVAGQMRALDRFCPEFGRAPSEIDRIYLVGTTEARPLSDVESFARFVDRYEAIGFTDLVFHLPRSDDPIWNESPEIIDSIAERFLNR